jgi:hypothetical protein
VFETKYELYLLSEHWQNFRKEVLRHRRFCERCHLGRPWAKYFYGQDLNVHHLNYACLNRETHADVAVLCVRCHAEEHGVAAPQLFPERYRTPFQRFADSFAFPK